MGNAVTGISAAMGVGAWIIDPTNLGPLVPVIVGALVLLIPALTRLLQAWMDAKTAALHAASKAAEEAPVPEPVKPA